MILEEARAACHAPLPLVACEPDAAAMLSPSAAMLTFAALRARVASYSAGFERLGIARHDLIAIAMPHSADLLCAFLGVAGACAAAPLDYALPEPEYRSLLERLAARALLVPAGTESPAEAAARSLGVPVIEARAGETEVSLGWKPFATDLSPRPPRRVPGDVVLVLETSATTGSPKLVPLTAANLHAQMQAMRPALDFGPADRFLTIMPLTHLLGLACALAQLHAGGCLICVDGFSALEFGSWLRDFRPTWYSASPTVHRAVLKLIEENPGSLDTASLRFIRAGSAALDPGLAVAVERALHVRVMDGYGLTEAGQVTCNRPATRKPGSAGRSTGSSVAIMDAAGALLPVGSEGEIVLRGPAVMPGYLDDPDGDGAFRDGWFRTGDVGRLDAEGDLYVTGRIKEAIKRGGETIAPMEIDRALAEHPSVADAAAFGVPHPTLGEDIAAAVVLHPGARATAPELRQYLAAKLAHSRLPNRFFFPERIPMGRNGKPSRRLLSEQFREMPAAAMPETGPADGFEQRIAAIWARILGVPAPQPADNFFALGGDSLSAATMLATVQRELGAGRQVFERPDFVECPTVERLAEILCERPGNDTHAEVAVAAPFFCFPGASQDVFYLRHLREALREDRPFVVLRDEPAVNGALPALNDLAARFVLRIRALKAHGPYILGGHCYGGIVAYECAQRLIALGESVPLLVLFDTPTPGYPKPLRHWKQYARHGLQLLARGPRHGLAEIGSHINYLSRILRPRIAQVAYAAPQTANDAASIVRTYTPHPFPGRIVHFIAAGAQVSSRVLEDARLGWRDFARRGFEVYRAGGEHHSMFSEQHAPQLAAQLRLLFNQHRL